MTAHLSMQDVVGLERDGQVGSPEIPVREAMLRSSPPGLPFPPAHGLAWGHSPGMGAGLLEDLRAKGSGILSQMSTGHKRTPNHRKKSQKPKDNMLGYYMQPEGHSHWNFAEPLKVSLPTEMCCDMTSSSNQLPFGQTYDASYAEVTEPVHLSDWKLSVLKL
eukprot:TRINITY_DN1654_c0_g1_i2.p1 TRINITY_DN1654_c0_g1~~TRINITY_DN1654_c0_g1_i2.p1  ORF type:complete len:162 (-),score=27.50 TRINITY_DN1654_c0_g1_i2:378-863(-)